MKKGMLFIVLLWGIFISNSSDAQSWQWGKEPSSTGDEGYLCATDKFGHVYGVASNFVTRYDTAGNFQWLRSIPSEFLMAITTDNSGNLYELGYYRNPSITIGSYTLTNTHKPYTQFFIAKYNLSGSIVWANNIGNVVSIGDMGTYSSFSYYSGIATDNQGNIYVACPFTNNPTLGSFSFTNNDPTDSSNDILVAKMDSNGSVLWAKSYGGMKNDIPGGIFVTNSNDIYLDGIFSSDTLVFGSSILTDTASSLDKTHIFLAKLNNSGIPLWAVEEGGTCNNIWVTGPVSDDSDNAYIAGVFVLGTVTFDTFSFLSPVASYENNGFLTKYDTNGNVVWAKETNSCVPANIAIDQCNNIWINGWMNLGNDTIDGHIISSPPHSGFEPMFIAGWASSGTFIEATGLASGGDDQSQIAFDCKGDLYVCGDYAIDTFYVGPDTLYRGIMSEYAFIEKYATGTNCNRCNTEILVQKDIPLTQEITLFPNPAYSECTISYTGSIYVGAKVAIYDITGRLIYTYPLTGSNTTISITDLLPGMYQCRIDVDGVGAVTRKLVVMR